MPIIMTTLVPVSAPSKRFSNRIAIALSSFVVSFGGIGMAWTVKDPFAVFFMKSVSGEPASLAIGNERRLKTWLGASLRQAQDSAGSNARFGCIEWGRVGFAGVECTILVHSGGPSRLRCKVCAPEGCRQPSWRLHGERSTNLRE